MPLQTPATARDKIKCVDADGYLYLGSCQQLKDKRAYKFDKWKKSNPYKCKNMRLYASLLDPNSEIVSSDEELQNADKIKTKFRCPLCKKVYEKRWYHWIAQSEGHHLCQQCSSSLRAKTKALSYEELKSMYADKGLALLSDYQYYLNNGGVYARMHCEDKDGYKYTTNTYALKAWRTGNDIKYSLTNPYAIENLQHWCDINGENLNILSIEKDAFDKTEAIVQCSCGNIFRAHPYLITNKTKTRCHNCVSKESGLERMTREWLEANNIPYEREYRFKDCKNKRPLPFDFKVDWKGKIILVEVDGGQHYKPTQWMDESDMQAQQKRDKIKTEYCKNHDYQLLRLPFWWFNTTRYEKELNETFFG